MFRRDHALLYRYASAPNFLQRDVFGKLNETINQTFHIQISISNCLHAMLIQFIHFKIFQSQFIKLKIVKILYHMMTLCLAQDTMKY